MMCWLLLGLVCAAIVAFVVINVRIEMRLMREYYKENPNGFYRRPH